jgi:glutathione-independent formaldehyde dehydrogenase
MPFNIACGSCFNCTRGFTNACLTVNPSGVSGGYGYAGMGPYPGGQAELLRVPFADFNCLKLPGQPGDELEDDFLLLSDVFPTGYHGAELASVGAGDTVAVFGAGPVGLLAAYSSMLRGAAEVYIVDNVPARLSRAEQIGAIAIDFSKGPPSEQIMTLRRKNTLARAALRPGEEKMMGVMCGIDAVGYQAREVSDPRREQPTQILEELVKVVNPTGRIGIVGVYFSEDPEGVDEGAKRGRFQAPLGDIFEKGLTIGTGQTPVKRYNTYLRDLIIAGRAKPSFIVSHRLPLDEAPDAYRKFDLREDGYTKVILKPGLEASPF